MAAMVKTRQDQAEAIENVLVAGNLAALSTEERLSYYQRVCSSLGLNPWTRPFEYITLQGKMVLYARKDATEQLRKLNRVSITKLEHQAEEGVYIVTAYARTADGREDSSVGAVPIENLKGEARANAMMKAETKAKRRVTLSICGLGMLDETEVESIPDARPAPVNIVTGEVVSETPQAFSPSATSAPQLTGARELTAEFARLVDKADAMGGFQLKFRELHPGWTLEIKRKAVEDLATLVKRREEKLAAARNPASALPNYAGDGEPEPATETEPF